MCTSTTTGGGGGGDSKAFTLVASHEQDSPLIVRRCWIPGLLRKAGCITLLNAGLDGCYYFYYYYCLPKSSENNGH